MTPEGPIAVTGATGNVGRPTLDALVAAGAPVRALVRSPARFEAMPGVEAARLDFDDPGTFAPAVAGCRALFLLRPPAIGDMRRTLIPLLEAADAAGVGAVVFVSVLGAERKSWVPHAKVEAWLRDHAMPWCVLRPGFFAQNLGDTYRHDIAEADRIYVPAGQGRVAWIDARDIGEAAARVLLDPGPWLGRCLPLTGPEALTLAESAAVVGEVLGRPIRYEAASALGFARHLRRRGLGRMATLVLTVLHVGLRRGDAAAVDGTLAALLGRAPRTLADYVRDHRALFARPGAAGSDGDP